MEQHLLNVIVEQRNLALNALANAEATIRVLRERVAQLEAKADEGKDV